MSLRFALTRSIRLRDIVAFCDFLGDSGHDVSLLKRAQGGIDFSYQQSGGKDIRWPKFENVGVDADGCGFVKPLSTIACEYEEGMPLWHPENSIGMRLKELGGNSFSEQEKCDIRRGMVNCLGVTDNVIYNRDENRFKILQTDGARDVDLFVEYDREKEATTWTVPCPNYGDCYEERLFKCWRCAVYRKEFEFEPRSDGNGFYSVLEDYVNSYVTCCDVCVRVLTMCRAPPPGTSILPPKRRKT